MNNVKVELYQDQLTIFDETEKYFILLSSDEVKRIEKFRELLLCLLKPVLKKSRPYNVLYLSGINDNKIRFKININPSEHDAINKIINRRSIK